MSSATSSSVSVPCVTTTPRPEAASAAAARAIPSASSAVTRTPGFELSVRAVSPGVSRQLRDRGDERGGVELGHGAAGGGAGHRDRPACGEH